MSTHMKTSSRLLRTALLVIVLGLMPGPLYEVQRGQIAGQRRSLAEPPNEHPQGQHTKVPSIPLQPASGLRGFEGQR